MSLTSSGKLLTARPGHKHGRRRVALLTVLLLVLPAAPRLAAAQTNNGRTAHPITAPGTSSANSELPKVTIEAAKERVLRREVHRFVAAVVVRPTDETLWRWNTPVCPLVAGLPKPFAEFILRRISKAATDAHAPLAGRVCRPNLYVIGTNAPDLLLRKWLAREPLMYDTRHGFGPVKRFLDSKRPVRVWYNSELSCGDGAPVAAGSASLSIASVEHPGGVGGGSTFYPGAQACTDGIDTHVSYADARAIYSALIVIDGRQMKKVDIQQLADYVALAGLADVRLDGDPGAAPTILSLFAGRGTPSQGLTRWDRALLYSLYNTRQQDKQQIGDMESTMVERIAPTRARPHANGSTRDPTSQVIRPFGHDGRTRFESWPSRRSPTYLAHLPVAWRSSPKHF